MITVKRALLSCHDKAGLDDFAKALSALGVELVASGGTAEYLAKHGLRVVSVEQFAGIGEQLDGRVKTLHPKIHAGILARRDDPAHIKTVGPDGLIDLVVVNLYPFEQTIQKPGLKPPEAIEQIDIGGVALLRAAAKNFSHVGVVCSPAQYPAVAEALQKNHGKLIAELTRQLAVDAFALTSRYDAQITGYLAAPPAQPKGGTQAWPGKFSLHLAQKQLLRYGENPHQAGAWYVQQGQAWGLGSLKQLQGKELSYNNLLDIDAAIRSMIEFKKTCCVIIKHNSQCGLAISKTAAEAYALAYACDSESAFGGIVGFNCPVDEAAAEQLVETFLEVIVAPQLTAAALALLSKKPNLRVVTVDWPVPDAEPAHWRQLLGAWVVQSADNQPDDPRGFRVVSRRAPTASEQEDLFFAWVAAKHAKSNAVVIAKNGATVGIGQGQPSRVGSVRVALQKAGNTARGAVCASDGFFPFADGLSSLAKAGVTAVVQPGGSIRDNEVIAAADAASVAMCFSGVRHFRH